MKKKLALLLACVVTVVSVAACGGGKSDTSTTTGGSSGGNTAQTDGGGSAGGDISMVMTWWGNQVRNDRTQAALDLYEEQNPGISFDGQFSEWDDYWTKMATASAGHNLPDVMQMDYKYLEQYANNDLLVDLTPYIEDGTIDTTYIDSSILEAGRVGDGIYALCIGINAPAMMYNKTLLDEIGIEIHDYTTLDEFIEISREVYEKTGYKTNISYGNDENFITWFVRSYGDVIFEKGGLGISDSSILEDFFQIYETGIAEGWHISPNVFAERVIGTVEQAPLVYGSSPEQRSWCDLFFSNQAVAMINAAPDDMEVGITTWPSNDVNASNYLKPGQFLSITVDSANPDEAANFLNFFTNSIECNEILLGERGVPIASNVAEGIAPLMSDLDNLVIDYINNVVTPNCSPINPPDPDGTNEVVDLMKRLQEQVCYGQLSAKEAGQKLFEEGNAILSSK